VSVPPPPTIDSLDVARDYMRAFNRADRDALLALYDEGATFDAPTPIWPDDGDAGRAAAAGASTGASDDASAREALPAAERIAYFLDTYDGAFAGGLFFQVRTIARIETGWTHVEWEARLRNRATAEDASYNGYFHFLIGNGRIRQQRGVAHLAMAAVAPAAAAAGAEAEASPSRSSRVYPSRPIVGVGGVIIKDGQVVLIKRKFEPLAGQWSLPGGSLEVGETLEAGVAREMLEETGLVVDVGPVIDVFDRILLDADQKVRFHFVLIDYLCIPRGGELRADSDVADAVFVDPDQLAPYKLTPKAAEVIRKAFALWRQEGG
jgi:ADP-ribose pyrophosphatase YjhB (NUDIX family)